MSKDGKTIYALTAYSGGTVVAMRRQPDGSIGAMLNCASAESNPTCALTLSQLTNGRTVTLGGSGQLLIGSDYGMAGAVTALGTKSDGSIDSLLNCVATAGSGPWVGCASLPGLNLVQDVKVGPGGTIYVATFSSYTEGTILALGATANGSIGASLSCWETTGTTPTYGCPAGGGTTGFIASPTELLATDNALYVASTEYDGFYGVITTFKLAPGGAIEYTAGCVSDVSASEPSTPCAATAPGLKGARTLALSGDGRLYVGSSRLDGSWGSVNAFTLQASGGIGTILNCLGSDVSTGCPSAPGLRGLSGLTVAADGNVYASSNYGATDGAATALSRQANGALSGVISCVGVTSATGCPLLAPGLEGANGIAGSPGPAMSNVYVASRFMNAQMSAGVDGALAALAREIAPVCGDATASAFVATAVAIKLPCQDPNRDPLTYLVVTGPTHGTLGPVDASGDVTYTPAAGFKGADSFTVKASDGTLESRVATVNVTVAARVKAKVTKFKVAPKRFAVKKKRKSATFRYTTDRPGRIRIQILRCKPGKSPKKKGCVKRAKVGAVTRVEKKAGARKLAFTGKVRGKALKPGQYRASIVLTPKAPFVPSQPRQAKFTVKRR